MKSRIMEIPKLNQSPVTFDAENHRYFLNGKQLKGITSTLVRRAYPDTYATPENISEEQWEQILKNAANKGTLVHQTIELYEDLGIESDMPELKNYISIKEDNGFTNVATEYIVSDEENYASSIDHVWVSSDGGVYLIDIKRTSEIHWDEVTCQLSIYKYLFEKQNRHLKVSGIALLWLRDEESEFRILTPLSEEAIVALIEADLNGDSFDIRKYYGGLPAMIADAEEQIVFLEADIKKRTAEYNKLKEGLLSLMQQYGVKKYSGSKVMLTVTPSGSRTSFDTAAFKHDHAELYESYKTTIETKPSLRITIKK